MSNIGNVGYNAMMVQQLVKMRSQMSDLTLQFTSGLKAQTYGGLGSDRSLALSLKGKISQLNNYGTTINTLGVRLDAMQTTLDRMNALTTETNSNLDLNTYSVLSDGKTQQQKTSYNSLVEMVDLLNTDVAGRYLYGGRRTTEAPVVSVDTMLNGSGAKAGYKQVASERLQADQGTGTGRVTASIASDTVSLAEDGVHPFGMKISSVQNNLSNVTVSGPSGSPAQADVQFTGQPSDGQTLTYTMTLPDGTTTNITLIASTDTTDADKGTFAIGATPADTAANFQTALQGQLEKTTKTTLAAASAFKAADDFFNTTNGRAPQRVDGPPFDTATAMVDGTDANTVMWCQGENTQNTTPGWTPRQDITTSVDNSVAVQSGVRANEDAFVWTMSQYAAMATIDASSNDATGKALHQAAISRAKANLAGDTSHQEIQTIQTEIVQAQRTVKLAQDRHETSIGTYQTTLDGIQNSDANALAVQLTTMQTRLQASYSATSILFKMSLTNYL